MQTRYILFVDDELSQRDLFTTALRDWNDKQEGTRSFEATLCANFVEACAVLKRSRFDCALFDLRIPNGARGRGTEPAGNELARVAMTQNGIPVALISADKAAVDPAVSNLGLLKFFGKGDYDRGDGAGGAYDKAMNWFGEQWYMMEVLAGAREQIDACAAEVFLKRLWPHWKDFAELDGVDRATLTTIVARQYAGHIAELMGRDVIGNASWHPFENYISPVMHDHANTGDIFKIDDVLWVVLSPQCDMAVSKIDNVVMARCEAGIEGWDDHLAGLGEGASNSKREKAEKFFRRHVNQNLSPAEHFLPPLPGKSEPLIVDFSKVRTWPLAEVNGEMLARRVASIAPAFLSNLIQRFGAYISRTGQPNIDMLHLRPQTAG